MRIVVLLSFLAFTGVALELDPPVPGRDPSPQPSEFPFPPQIPKEATIFEVGVVPESAHGERSLVLWAIDPERHPRETEEHYTCPETTMGHYYEGSIRISLVDTRRNQALNTIELPLPDGKFEIPYLISKHYHYRVPNPTHGDEGVPVIFDFRDRNGDGKPHEFAFFRAYNCNCVMTLIAGYSERRDQVMVYPFALHETPPSSSGGDSFWMNRFLEWKAIGPGVWEREEYTNSGIYWYGWVRYDAARERFAGSAYSQDLN